MKQKGKPEILLVAVCKPGVIGGQATSARLLVQYLGDEFTWRIISLPAPGLNVVFRLFSSVKIFFQAWWLAVIHRIRIVHLFTSCTRMALFEKLLLGYFLRLTGARSILNFRGAFDQYYNNCSRAEKKMLKVLLNAQSIVLCQHNGTKDFLLANGIVAENKIRVIPNAVDAVPLPITNNDVHLKKKILCLTWIISHKGLDLLIRAASLVKSGLLENNFVIEVCGPEEEPGLQKKLQELIDRLEASEVIHFIPPASGDKKNQLLAGAEIFVLPTRREGFPNALLEAMAAGLPVVTTDKSPMNTIIANGSTGLLFEEGNDKALAEKIMLLVRDESQRKRLGEAGKQYVTGNFSPSKVMTKFKELYHELTNSR